MSSYIESFLEMLLAVNNISINTWSAYKSDILAWKKFINPCKLENATSALLSSYIEFISNNKYSSSSIRRKIASIRHFYKFLVKEGVILYNPTLQLEKIKKERKLPKFLSINMLNKIFIEAENDKSAEGIRSYAFLEILYSTGMRISELTALKLSQVRPLFSKNESNFILIKGKGEKERAIFFTDKALVIIKKYIDTYKLKDNDWLFPGDKKRGRKNKSKKELPMTRQRFGQLLKQLAIRAEINPKYLSPHILRHSFATHLMDKGLDIKVIQELLGHTSITTTQIYTYIANSQLHEVVSKYHPLSRELL